MNTFTIDSDNNITAHAALPASADNLQSFSSAKDLDKLTAGWPVARLVETWNSFAGVAPFDDLKLVKKFTNRKAAVARIWKAVERLAAHVAPPAAPVAAKKGKSKKSPTAAKSPVRTRKGATIAREGSKKAQVLDRMGRKEGVTLAEIMKETGWQAHTVRGFVSGTITKKLGKKVDSFKNADGERAYRILK
jgi:hypothetical protein